jgi:ABC-type uncharacterized transport system substrate-binding protein
MLRDMVPGLRRVAVLWNPANQDHPLALTEAERTAQQLGLEVVAAAVKGPGRISTNNAPERRHSMPDGIC